MASVFGIIARLWPVWLGLVVFFGLVLFYRKRLGLLGQMLGNSIGIAGLVICAFWLLTAIFATTIAPLDPRIQVSIMKNAVPGAIDSESGIVFLLGGDQLARDVFSRVVYGAHIVLTIAPAATADRAAGWRSRSACLPAISADGSTASCPSSPISCWPSR